MEDSEGENSREAHNPINHRSEEDCTVFKDMHPMKSTIIKNKKEFMPLRICTFNAQDLKPKFAQLRDYVHETDADILIITETWFDDTVQDSEYLPKGYKSFRQDRQLDFYKPGTYVNKQRGGVLILCKENLNPTRYTKADVGRGLEYLGQCWFFT